MSIASASPSPSAAGACPDSSRLPMSIRTKIFPGCLLAAALALPALCLADKANEKPIAADSLASFEREATAVREGMQPGGTYQYIKDADKARVEKRLDDMHRLLQDHGGIEGLSKDDKVALLNEQEELNALLLQNDSNRLVCERGAHTGSRIHVTTCQTYGEIMQRQSRDQHSLDTLQRAPQTQRDGL